LSLNKKRSGSPLWRSATWLILAYSLSGSGQEVARHVKVRVQPGYPPLARRMNLGGHPVLIEAAEIAVRQWRFDTGPESTEVVEIKFNNSGQ
jgi:hypothetical protein